MDILLHVCCGPCTIYPLKELRTRGFLVSGYFYNPNIHPFREFRKRIRALEQFAAMEDFPVEIEREYGLRQYLRKVVFHEDERCGLCYAMRLEQVATRAATGGYSYFSTTLLYSRYQNHELIRRTGERLADKYGIGFYYQDFRKGWQYGIDRSLEMDLYRQPYCGCIYSEQERYDRKLQKQLRRAHARHNRPGNVERKQG